MNMKISSLIIIFNVAFAVGHRDGPNNRRFNKPYPYKKTTLPAVPTKKYDNDVFNTESETNFEDPELQDTVTENQVHLEPNTGIECQQNQSAFSQNDLVLLINIFAADNNLIEHINETYLEHAMSVHDEHENSLIEFLNKFDHRPTHLQHIIDDMVRTRQTQVEPLAIVIASKSKDFAVLNESYNKKSYVVETSLKKLEKYKEICKLACDDEIIYRSSSKPLSKRSSTEEEYYCATLEEVKNTINTELSTFANDFIEKLTMDIDQRDSTYEENIKELKIQMKEVAVKEFGTTMYDVLSLQDEYNHFLNKFNGKNITEKLINIKKSLSTIDIQIDELDVKMEQYRKHCLKCARNDSSKIRRDVSQTDTPVTSAELVAQETNDIKPQDNNQTTILEKLIQVKVEEVESIFENDLNELFKHLNDTVFNKDKIINEAVAKLKPLQTEFELAISKEEQEFDNLKRKAPISFLDDVSKLTENADHLIDLLDDAINSISLYI